ncbi:MAG: MFS transporter [Clostridia bacterium]|nr:MFS transporter [Clostridia bacterium]
MTEQNRKYLPTKLAGYVGFVVQAIVNNFLPILFIVFQDIYGLGYEKLGRLIVFNFALQMFIDFLTPKIIHKIGYRSAAFLCQFTACLGLCLMAILPRVMPNPYVAMFIAIAVYATGSGLMEVILSPMIEMLPTSNKSGNMAVLHSFYCWGQTLVVPLTTAMVVIFGRENWSYIPLVWAVVPFINMLAFLRVPIVEPGKEEKQSTLIELLKTPTFIVYMFMMFCGGASEIAMSQWASLFVEQALGVSKAIGDIVGPCLFALFMALGRVIYAKFSKMVSFTRVLIWLNILCFVCYVMVGLCKIAALSLIFCALCGFSVSISWPGIYSAGARTFKTGGAVMFSAFAMCGDTGCALGPGLVGLVAEYTNLNIGFLAAAVFPLIMVICSLYILKFKVAKTENK